MGKYMTTQSHRSIVKSSMTFSLLALLISSTLVLALMLVNGLMLYPLVSVSDAFTAILPFPIYLYSYYGILSIIFTAMYIDKMPHKNFIIVSIVLGLLGLLVDTWYIGRFSLWIVWSVIVVSNLALYGLSFLLLKVLHQK